MKKQNLIYDSFARWVEAEVLSLHRPQLPKQKLGGLDAGDNRNIVGRFKYLGRLWGVNSDTHFAPVIVAYEAIRYGQVADPFEIKPTETRQCLNLKPELQKTQRPKRFYVYELAQ